MITLGGNPLYGKDGKGKPTFEQRIEIYSPPYLYHGNRPVLGDGPQQVRRGTSVTFAAPDAADIETARLIRPSAVTHVTNLEQRSGRARDHTCRLRTRWSSPSRVSRGSCPPVGTWCS